MKTLNDHEPMYPSDPMDIDGTNGKGQSGVTGNERLTALAGAVLLVLILLELVSSVSLHIGITIHIVVGVLLVGPLLVKIGSTGYRFLRYYIGSPAYVRKGPPRLPLRLLAPLLLVATLVVVGSGLGLVVTGPQQAGPLLPLHNLSVLVWLSLVAVHVCAYLWQTSRLVVDDWSKQTGRNLRNGRWLRLGMNLIVVLCGAVAAILLFPNTASWVVWSQTGQTIAAPLVVGLVLVSVVLLVSRPWRWR